MASGFALGRTIGALCVGFTTSVRSNFTVSSMGLSANGNKRRVSLNNNDRPRRPTAGVAVPRLGTVVPGDGRRGTLRTDCCFRTMMRGSIRKNGCSCGGLILTARGTARTNGKVALCSSGLARPDGRSLGGKSGMGIALLGSLTGMRGCGKLCRLGNAKG